MLHRLVPSHLRYEGNGLDEVGEFAQADEIAVATHCARPREVIVAKGEGKGNVLAKIGRGVEGDLVARERLLPTVAERLQNSSLSVPTLLGGWSTPTGQVIVQSLIEDGRPPRREEMPEVLLEAAVALAEAGITHGDLAPWNLLITRNGLTVIDWEFGSTEHHPGEDLTHFLVQSAVLGKWWNAEQVASMLTEPDGPGTAYRQATGMSLPSLCNCVFEYLDAPPRAAVSSPDAIAFRTSLAIRLHSRIDR
jgi:hypothetical protein